MTAIHTRPNLGGSHSSIRGLVIWATLVATIGALGLLLAPAIPANQKQNNVTSSATSNGFDSGVIGEPYHFDHSVVNNQNLPDEPNPAPMAIAAYD